MINAFARQPITRAASFNLRAEQRLLIGVWLLVQCLDVVTTAVGLRSGLVEGNGFAAHLIARYGEWSAYGFKALATVAVIACILLLHRRYARLWLALRIVSVYMFCVVAFNLANIVWS